jgi:hypothetical protein
VVDIGIGIDLLEWKGMNDGQLYGLDYGNKGEKKRQEMIF